jgi:hypothetical protein
MIMCSRRCSIASDLASRPVGSIEAWSASVHSFSSSMSFSMSSVGSAEYESGAMSVVGSAPSVLIFSTSRRASARSASAKSHSEPHHAARGERVLDRGAVLQPQRLLEALDLRLDVEFLVLAHGGAL